MHAMILGAAALTVAALALSGPTPGLTQAAQCPTQADSVPIEGAVVRVSYADLDLARPNHVRVLDRRLNLAASRVCDSNHLAIGHYRLRHLCIRQALCDARQQVAAQTQGHATTLAALVRPY